MEQMPGGRPRFSSPSGAAPPTTQPSSVAFAPYRRIDAIRRAPRLSPTVRIGGQTYREVDNGRANVLVPVDDTRFTPAERAAQQEGIVRSLFMAEHPFGAIGYGVAATAGAPQRTRDALLQGLGLVDEAASGGVFRARITRPRPNPPQQALNLTRPSIVYRERNAEGQARGATASVAQSMRSNGTKARRRIRPVGYVDSGEPWNHDKGHLIASRFGGSGRDPANLMTLERSANQEHMKDFENDVARRVRGGETIDYSVTPLYANGRSPPSLVLMTAFGHREGPKARLIRNLAGPLR